MLDAHDLIDFLELIQTHLDREITLVAAGGTALTLLDLKPSTRDVDFTGPAASITAFKGALRREPHGFKVDVRGEGWVFATGLPADYLDKSVPIQDVGHIHLHALHPLDVIVTKLGRFDARDHEDIHTAIRKHRLQPEDVERRASMISYAANDRNYAHNLKVLLHQMRTQ